MKLPASTSTICCSTLPPGKKPLKQYLLKKSYSENELIEASLIIATEERKTHDRFRNRLMFPINDARGRVTGFGARVLDDSLPKYFNSSQTPTFDKSSSLYGINLATATIKQLNQAVIVEGYMDVIIPHQYGFNNVVAAMGTSITEKQMSALKRLTRNMVLALDADNAGEEAMLRCVDYENSLDAEVKVVILPSGKDPDEVIKEDARSWQRLLDEALPVIDYTFNMVASKLDLTTARDKSLAREQLLPIIARIKDSTRQDHYLTKLARLTGTSYRNLETTLSQIKTKPGAPKPRAEAMKRALLPLRSNPLEEYCLALLLQHPELKDRKDILPEYFENSENREIFVAWQQTDNPDTIGALKDKLDTAIREHLESLINKNMPVNQTELRYADCVLNLRKKFFQNLEAKKAEVLALEAEVGGSGADLDRLKEQGIEPSIQLREVFAQKARRGNG
ncbi:MAG: toprim domain-containing protein [Chloroflexi bacterium]|nr:toprim domain-containing protein [Chloroflexota bacterium]